MFTLAHLSDPHLPMPAARPGQLLNKRATGYVNWWRNRVHLHRPEALAGIVADIKTEKPDHIALTGDLVNVALPEEFRCAAAWLAAFDRPDRLTVIPGNHDVYVPIPWDEGLGLWGAYMAGDGQPSARGFDVFPTIRRRDGVALIGLSTGVPKPPLFATGDLGSAQIARAEQLLVHHHVRSELAGQVDLVGMLDPDDISAEHAQLIGRERPSQDVGQVHHPNALERSGLNCAQRHAPS